MESGRLLVVSNRLPVTVDHRGDAVRLVDSNGGLATGLRAHHEDGEGLWIGWPGETHRLAKTQQKDLDAALAARRLVQVPLTVQEVRQYYEGFANSVLWPLFHYMLERVPMDARTWTSYQQVNEKFADAVVSRYRPGDLIWVQDYHLMLVPGMIRQRLPEARIGFFLHIPFPSSELFRTLPWRRTLLEGVLGADLIGFHVRAYLRHFAVALRHVTGLDPGEDEVHLGERDVRLGTFPMGVDTVDFQRLGTDPEVAAEALAIRRGSGDRTILLAVDRLDYTKGIPRRLLAIERLLEAQPSLRDRVRFVQIAAPSRAGAESYQAFRRQVEEIVGRINGRFGTLGAVPIHYLYRSFDRRQLAAMYRAADVMLVTPIRDGMNLVAKEFVSTRVDEDGVLVLSEFAGASAELGEALSVNPFDVDGMAEIIHQAIDLDPQDRRARMKELRRRVLRQDVRDWARQFVAELDNTGATPTARPRPTPPSAMAQLVDRLRETSPLVVLADYDGTLVPIANTPELARPDRELRDLLRALAASPGRRVHVVSGRPRETMDEWFGSLPLALWAEHGLWRRDSPHDPWVMSVAPDRSWMDRVRPALEAFAARTAGARVEEKTASLAWHYRLADHDFGLLQAGRLRSVLVETLRGEPVEVIEGHKVIEVRPAGTTKGLAVERVLAAEGHDAIILALGDDTTDEDMFTALPASGIAVHVGPGESRAPYRLANPFAVRSFLGQLVIAPADAPIETAAFS